MFTLPLDLLDRPLRALCRGPGVIAPRGSPRHRLPLVALMPQWRQNYPNNRTQRPKAMTAEMGHRTKPLAR
jgi:hypothetical protein